MAQNKFIDFEYMADEDLTYTILTKNNNFYAGGVLVHSEITRIMFKGPNGAGKGDKPRDFNNI